MAILETFYILFKSDASNVKKGADEADASTKKLAESLASVNKGSEKAGSSFLNFAQSAVKLFAGIASTSAIISNFHSAVRGVSELGNLSRALNVDVEALDAWGHAVQRTGGTAQSFQSSLQSLATHFQTTPAIALSLLPKLANAFSKFNQFQANAYGKNLGLDQSTIYLLQQGRREVEATIAKQKNLGVVTQQQVEQTRKYDNALYDAKRAYQTFSRELAIPLLPGFTKAINYLLNHKDALTGVFATIGIAAAALSIRLALLNKELSLIVAAIGAVGIAYEDIKGFVEGNKETVLGDLTGLGKEGLKSEKIKNFHPVQNFVDSTKNVFSLLSSNKSLQRTASFDNPFAGFSLNNAFFDKITGHNALSSPKQTFNFSEITVNTQATDAQAMAYDFTKSISDQLFQLNSQVDNGVQI